MSKSKNQKSSKAAHKKGWQTFEVVFGIPFIAAIILHFIKPLVLANTFLISIILLPVGIFLIILGLIFIILARRKFAQYNQSTVPGHPTKQLLTSGVFSISRNPLYFGGICILIGVALVFELSWVLVFLLPTFIVGHYILILPEEQYLANKFGEEYRIYTASVYRWFGRNQCKAP